MRICGDDYFWREILLCQESTSPCSNGNGAYYLHSLWVGKKSTQAKVNVFTIFKRITESGAWLKSMKTQAGSMWKKIEMTTLNLAEDGPVFAMNRCRLAMKDRKTRWP